MLPGKKGYIIIIIVISILTGCSSDRCMDPLGCIELRPGEAIEIAILNQTTPDATNINQEIINAVEGALNHQPIVIQGYPIKLIKEETTCLLRDLPVETTCLVARLNLVGVIGPACNENYDFFSKTLSNAGLVVLSPNFTSALPSPGIYSVAPDTANISSQLARYIHANFPATTVVSIYEPRFAFWQKPIEKALSSIGHGTLVLLSETGAVNDLKSQIEQASQNHAGLLLYIGDEAALDTEARTRIENLSDVIIFNPYRFLSMSERISGSAWFRIGYNEPDLSELEADNPIAAFSLDAVSILISAVRSTAQKTINGRLLIPRQKVRETISHLRFQGIMGDYDCQNSLNCFQNSISFGH